MNMDFEKKLTIPQETKEMYPLEASLAKIVAERNAEIAKIFSGESDKLALIIGPCSADREDSVIDYISRLREVQEKVKDKIVIIPRIYTGKPRTTGSGYKGMLHNPDPEGHSDLFKGIIAIRELHMKALKETGFNCADEMLYPDNYKYLDDILAYVAIGARSVENQEHRLTASGIEVPVGMKNPTGGDLSVMMNAIYAGQHPHTFIYRGWQAHSKGNPLTHAILRGYNDKHGKSLPNYHFEEIRDVANLYAANKDLVNPAVIIDTNHANSGKDPFQQLRIAKEVMLNRQYSEDVKTVVKGFMTESYIEDGNQKIGDGVYGKSITDACIGWAKTEELIYTIADLA